MNLIYEPHMQGNVASQRNVAGDTAMLWASRSGKADIVSLLLSAAPALAATPNNEGKTPLMCAAAGGHHQLLKELLAASPTPDVDAHDVRGRTALHFAASSVPCIHQLLAAGARCRRDSDGKTALAEALRSGAAEAAALLERAWRGEREREEFSPSVASVDAGHPDASPPSREQAAAGASLLAGRLLGGSTGGRCRRRQRGLGEGFSADMH